MPRIVVTGSLNIDFVVQVRALPAAGETALGNDFRTIPGGKGANQACAAARLAPHGTSVAMIGCVGNDAFGDRLRASLTQSGVDVAHVCPVDAPSGIAMIAVDAEGQNSIVIAPGANAHFQAAPLYRGANVALFQLENPLSQVERALALAREAGALTILDPAPAQPLPRSLLELVDILTPNETEGEAFTGPSGLSIETAYRLMELGPKSVVLKLGAQGCLYFNGKETVIAPAFPVTAIDTTAAGDCFNGALGIALTEHSDLGRAMRFANAAAAISVTRPGAQPSMPTRAEVERIL